ncbi:MAG: PucR family transcriptional regulator [Lachnospiraceae bacterium]
MISEDLLQMQGLEGLSLVSGEQGLGRQVRWLYFVDAMQSIGTDKMLDSNEVGKWMKGGELIVITSEVIAKNLPVLKTIISLANEKLSSGIILNIGLVTEQIKEFTDSLGIPLFELGWELRTIDLSQIVCKAIMEDELNENSLERLFANIIYDMYDSEANVIRLAKHHAFDLTQPFCVAVADIANFQSYIDEHPEISEEQIQNIKKEMVLMLRQSLRKYGTRNTMTYIQSDCANMLLSLQDTNGENLRQGFCEAAEKFRKTFDLQINIGIGQTYEFISKIKTSLYEAEKMIKVAASQTDHIAFYEDSGLLALFAHIDNEESLKRYYQNILGKLEEVDHLVNSALCDTLEAFLFHDCMAEDTAKALFIHRNTLRYRLHKIEDILGISLESTKSCVELYNAFLIKQHLS